MHIPLRAALARSQPNGAAYVGDGFLTFGFNPHTRVLPIVVAVKARISKMLDIKTISFTALRCVCSTDTRMSDLTVGVAECTSRWFGSKSTQWCCPRAGRLFDLSVLTPLTRVLPIVVAVKARSSKVLYIMTINFTAYRCMCSTGTRMRYLTVGVAERTSRSVLVWLEINRMMLPTCKTAL